MNKAERCQEFVRVMWWLAEHPSERNMMLALEEPYKAEDYLNLISMLEEDSLEYLIPLVLLGNPFNEEFECALGRLTAEALIKQWERMGPKEFLRKLKALTEEELYYSQPANHKTKVKKQKKKKQK